MRGLNLSISRGVKLQSAVDRRRLPGRFLLTGSRVNARSVWGKNSAGESYQEDIRRPTIRDYVTLLERVFLLERLPPGTAIASNA